MSQWIKEIIAGLFGKKPSVPPVRQPSPIDYYPPTEPPAPSNIGKATLQERVFAIARSEMGVKEYKIGSNKTVEKYHAYSTEENKKTSTDDIAWCASFVCYCLEMAGLKSTNSKSARSYEKYGKHTDTPVFGDIVVFWRGSLSAGTGHVALFAGFDSDGNIKCLGGNQHDEVNITVFSRARLLGFRTYQEIR